MDLSTVIKKTEDLGITILFCNMPKPKEDMITHLKSLVFMSTKVFQI